MQTRHDASDCPCSTGSPDITRHIPGHGIVPQGVNRYRLHNPRQRNRFFQSALQSFFKQMMPPLDAAARVDGQGGRRKHPAPSPGLPQLRVFHRQRMRHLHTGALRLPVCIPTCPRRQHLQTKRRHQRPRQHYHPVLVALGFADDDHMAVKLNILDAQAHAFHQPHAGAV